MHYALQDNLYRLIHAGQTLDVMTEVAICYSEDSNGVVLLKHGAPERIRDYRSFAEYMFRENGFTDMADSLGVIQGRIDLDTLNTIILSNHALGQFLASQGQAKRAA